MPNKQIIITIKNGVSECHSTVPEGCEVVVRNYDTPCSTDIPLSIDKDGIRHCKSTYYTLYPRVG